MQSSVICSDIFNIKVLRTACVALLNAQVPLLSASLPLALHTPAATAETRKAEAAAKIAQAITVRIEGATQGSGVLVKRDGNRYTVLTAWHVVSSQGPTEELDIYTPDGRINRAVNNTVKRVGGSVCLQVEMLNRGGQCREEVQPDLAQIQFESVEDYNIAKAGFYYPLGESCRPEEACTIYVAGFPNESNGKFTLSIGEAISYGHTGANLGYNLVYSSHTRPGMSGGPVLDESGLLLGIHGRGEKKSDPLAKSNKDPATSLEINQGTSLRGVCQEVNAGLSNNESSDCVIGQSI